MHQPVSIPRSFTIGAEYVYDRPGHQVASARLPAQPQGESLAVRDGALLVGSEGERSAVYEVPVPGQPTATPDASDPTGIGRTAAAADEQGWRDAALVVRAGGIAAVLVLIVVALRRSRRR
jgi:hypothetical protein